MTAKHSTVAASWERRPVRAPACGAHFAPSNEVFSARAGAIEFNTSRYVLLHSDTVAKGQANDMPTGHSPPMRRSAAVSNLHPETHLDGNEMAIGLAPEPRKGR
jgi:hypothetical protein